MKRIFTCVAFFAWLTFLLFGLTAPEVRAQTNQGLIADSTELRILHQLYTATGGAQWKTHTNWPTGSSWPTTLTSADLATWYGVGVTNGDVTSLRLVSNNLRGSIPSSLGQLGQLQGLDLSQNSLGSTIPASLGQLTQLTSLSLAINQLSGAIPTTLGQLSRLQSLALNSNGLTGTIPAALGQLSQLRYLILYHTALSGSIPAELGQLSQLQMLELSSAALSGSIPVELGQLSQLQELLLGENQLTGAIPTSLGQLSNLTYLSLVENHLSGVIPTSLGQLAQLTYLELDYNQLTGDIPASLGQLTNLDELDLYNNQLSGPIPTELGQLQYLRTLNLSNNQLSGPIPASLGQLGWLEELTLNSNHLSGSIPAALGQLGSLRDLYLENNQLSGTIPSSLGQLTYLYALSLASNQLTGSIPSNLGQIARLQVLYLYQNQLSGALPTALCKRANLSLDVHDNRLTATTDLSGATNLAAYLALSGNLLDFPALERLYKGPNSARFQTLILGSQLAPPRIDTLSYRAGVSFTLSVPGASTSNTYRYQWQRQVSGQWLDMPGDTLVTKVWAQATAAQQGLYRLSLRDRWFTNPALGPTQLYSSMVYADLVPYQPLSRNLPDDTNQGLALFHPHAPADSAATQPADMNYVRTWVPRVALRHAPDQASPVQCTASGQILREEWAGVSGTQVSDIPLATLPTSFSYLLALEGPTNIGDNYGDRIRGYLCPPQTGAYTFWIAGDDQSELWLSTDDDPTHKVHLATVPGYTDSRQWDKYPEQQSALVNLVQGQRYYVEVLHKEGGGGDNVAVAWRLPDQTIEGPIAGSHLSPAAAPAQATAAVLREEWTGVGGTLISQIPLNLPPTRQHYLPTLEGPTNIGDEYGDRLRAYLTVPQSGQYTFWIAGDDNSELWLSTDESPAHKVHLATVPGSTDPRQWDKYPEQQSALVSLVAGQRYYVEVLHKEGGGGDNVAVAWRLPDGTIEGPVAGSHLSAVPVPAPGLVLREQWNVGGGAITDIPLHTTPSSVGYVATLETSAGLGNDYGARLSGYLTAPQTGNYTFWVAGDDAAELWLSPDADSSHQVRRAYTSRVTGFRQYDSDASQQSAPIPLVAGQRYYVRVLHKQQAGGDHLSVGWQLPDNTRETPIASFHLAPAGAPLTVSAVGSPAAGSPAAGSSTLGRSNWTVDSASITTQYLDGLGRPVQTVLHQASPRRRDLVQPQAYDALGREPKAYLPYAVDSTGTGSLGYHNRALTQQQQFYLPSGQQGPPAPGDPTTGVARTGVAFAETLFEAAPLNRVLAQGAPGEAWQLTNGHVTERLERPNTEKDSVLYFKPGYDPQSLDPGYQGFYKPGELWGVEIMDPHGPAELGAHGYKSIEWKDKLGQVVLKQVEVARAGRNDSSRWLRTSYVYDDFQRLRFVLQPEASKRVLALGDHAGELPTAALPFLFHYRYDARGRQVAKQVPGQEGETLVVYDQLDRPVLSQDAQQRTRQEWSWSKYDALGRVVLTGLVTRPDGLDQGGLQNLATADTATAHQYEQRTADATFAQHYTTGQAFPQLGQNGFGTGLVLTASYYDDYDFDNNGQADSDAHYTTVADAAFAAGQVPVADEARVTGMPTRTLTRVLNRPSNDPGAEWLSTTSFYDERGRVVQMQSTNARGGQDVVTLQLDFLGKPLRSVARHQGPSLPAPIQVVEAMAYDHAERLLRTSQQLPGEAGLVLLSRRAYNELGQLLVDSLASGRLAQQVKYAYNIRGWLTSLNNPYQPAPGDLFNLSLHYEAGFTKGYEQYNGNLTGQTWRGRDGVQRAYGYVYDPLNRLLQGDFVARITAASPSTGTWQAELDHYRLSFVSYDDNGNINTLRRQGLLQAATHNKAQVFGAVDNLTYAYQGNRLQAVEDQVMGNQLVKPASYHGAPTSLAGDFQDGGAHQGQEYLYDANGNLTQDTNKNIMGVLYNHLNLPRQIHFGQVGDSVVFRYAASGQKVAKLVYQTGKSTPTRTDYLGPYQYEQDSLKFFPHAAGRVLRFVSYDAANQPTVRYQREYTLKDHLGNLRLAYRAGQVRRLLATLEQDADTHKRESQQFDSLSVSTPIATSTGLAHSGQYVARLNAGGDAPQPLGPLTQLGVQKGDTVTVQAFGYYAQATQHGFLFSLASFIANLFHPTQVPPPGLEAQKRKGFPILQVGVAAGLASLPQLSGGVPKGYLRVLVFNRDSALVSQQVQQLSQVANGGYETLRLQLVLPQDGYVTTYVGNESDVDVLFDDVSVEHRAGLQVQENQYDPWGLSLSGVNYNSPGIQGLNRYQFNGKEGQNELSLNWSDYGARMYDEQLGRWHSVDPLAEISRKHSSYSYVLNNPIRFMDPDGMTWKDPVKDKAVADKLQKGISERLASENKNLQNTTGKIAKLEKKLSESKDGNTTGLQKRIDNAKGEKASIETTISDLNSSSSELTEMETTTSQVFSFNQLPSGSQEGETRMEGGIIVMNVTEGDDGSNIIHEAAHGYQRYKNMSFKDVANREVGPYQRQFSFSQSNPNKPTGYNFNSTVPSIEGSISSRSDITPAWVTGLHVGDRYPYLSAFGVDLKLNVAQELLKLYKEKNK